MSLWQKGKGLSRKVKVTLISIALALAFAVCGIVAAVSLSGNNKKVDGGIADGAANGNVATVAITPSTSLSTAPNGTVFYYTGVNTSTHVTTFDQKLTVNASATKGSATNPYLIRSTADWVYFTNQVNAGNASFKSGAFVIDAGGVLDFGNNVLTPVGSTSANTFTGILYGNNTTIKNAKIGYNLVGNWRYTGLFGFKSGGMITDLIMDSTCALSETSWNIYNAGAGLRAPLVGSFIAEMTGASSLVNCVSKMTITAKSTNTTAAVVASNSRIGGLIGQVSAASSAIHILNCGYLGNIDYLGSTVQNSANDTDFAGQVVGFIVASKSNTFYIKNSFGTSTIYHRNCGANQGVISGYPVQNNVMVLQNCVFYLTIDTKDNAGVAYPGTGYRGTSPEFGVFGGLGVNVAAGSSVDHCYFTINAGVEYGTRDYFTTNANIKVTNSAVFITSTNYNTGKTNASSGLQNSFNASGTSSTLTNSSQVGNAAKADSNITNNVGVDSNGKPTGSGSNVKYHISYVASLGGTKPADETYTGTCTKTSIANLTGTVNAGLAADGWALTPAGAKVTSLSGKTGNIVLYARYKLQAASGAPVHASGVYKTAARTISTTLTHAQVSAANAEFYGTSWVKGTTTITNSTGITVSANGANGSISFTADAATVAASGDYNYVYSVRPTAQGTSLGIITDSSTTNLKATAAKLTITKAEVTNPTFTTSFTYDKSVKNILVNAGDSNLYTLASGTATGTEARDYQAQYKLNDAANYKWKTQSFTDSRITLASESANLVVNWVINKAQIGGGGSTGGGSTEGGNTGGDDTPGGGVEEGDGEGSDGGNSFGSYVRFDLGNEGVVGLSLNNANHAVSIDGAAWFTYANGEKDEIPGKFHWKNPSEIISYKDYTEAMLNGSGVVGIYKTIAVFTPTDTSITPYEREVKLIVTGQYITLADVPVNEKTGEDLSAGVATKIWLDYATNPSVTLNYTAKQATVAYMSGGAAASKAVTMQAPAGYEAHLYYRLPTETEAYITKAGDVYTIDLIGHGDGLLYNMAFYVGYEPVAVNYEVYYVLENEEGNVVKDGVHYPVDIAPSAGQTLDQFRNALNAMPGVFHTTYTGDTASIVKYDEKLEATIGGSYEHYELHGAANGHLSSTLVGGDGKTVVIVYLRAKFYKVSFVAVGASQYASQTQQVKYNSKVDISKIKDPVKKGADFEGWYDTKGSKVDFNTYKILGETTFTAKFDAMHYYIVFNMNWVDGGADEACPANGINIGIVPRLAYEYGESEAWSWFEQIIYWDYKTLFGSNGESYYATETTELWNEGDYIFEYTVDSLTKNISMTSAALKPSALTYNFVNWYDSNNASVTSIKAPKNYSSSQTVPNVITLTAHWTKQSYNLVFDRLDGSRTTQVNGIANLSTWDAIFRNNAAISMKEPTRSGYVFMGWYGDDKFEHEVTEELGVPGYFSVYDYADYYPGVYGNEDEGYNFSKIYLYAKWVSAPIELNIELDLVGGAVVDIEAVDGGELGIDVTAKATYQVDDGYEFGYLVVGSRKRPVYIANGEVRFVIAATDVVYEVIEGKGYNRLDISAVFTEITYTISYNTDGGTSTDSNVVRTYTRSRLDNGLVGLPSNLKKLGYDFGGWKFENADDVFADDRDPMTGKYAFDTEGFGDVENSSLYGETLILITYKKPDNLNWYANFSLKAVWIPQRAVLRLYGATYALDDGYGDPHKEGYYEVSDLQGKALRTDDIIPIKSPVSKSFYFAGWATQRGGSIIYAADVEIKEGNTPEENQYLSKDVEYKLKASYDTDGNATGANYLYAVWRIKELSAVNITAENNNSVYDGKGVNLSARTAKEYADDVGKTITITYKWYRVDKNKYTGIFTVGQRIYLDEFGVELGKINYNSDGQEESREGKLPEDPDELAALTYIEVKTLNKTVLEENGSNVKTESRSGTALADAVALNVKAVNESGIYICLAELSVSGGDASTAFGEITVEISKAKFNSVVFQSASKAYNGTAQSIAVVPSDKDAVKSFTNNKFTLLDDSIVNITYKYKLADSYGTPTKGSDDKYYDAVGNLVDESGYVLNANGEGFAQAVTNAGLYNVTAMFEIEGVSNYDVIKTLSAEFEIKQKTLTNVSFGVEHEVEGYEHDGKFNFTYDGVDYKIVAIIDSNDIYSDDEVGLNVNIFTASDSGNKQTLVIGNAINVGKYLAEIDTKLIGEKSSNYVLGAITTTQLFEIVKGKRDYNITFEGIAPVTFDNKIHTVEINSGDKQLPEELEVVYSVKATLEEELDGYLDAKNLPNNEYVMEVDGRTGKVTNGGRHAGTYEVSVQIIDAESANYEAIEIEPVTFTIKKANLFEYYGEDESDRLASGKSALLGGFESRKYSFVVGANRMTFISGTELTRNDYKGEAYFGITYTVSQMIDDSYYMIAMGSEDYFATVNPLELNASGSYKIDAEIEYNSPWYKNNFEEVETQSITIDISDGVIENIEVVYKSGDMLQYIGETFNMSEYVEKIRVKYEGGEDNVNELDTEAELATVKVLYDNAGVHETFWKVGEALAVNFEVYGVFTAGTKTIKIMQKITEGAELKYTTDEGAAENLYKSIPEYGLNLDLISNGGYYYRLFFNAVNEEGIVSGKSVVVNVDAGKLVRGKNEIKLGNEGLYDLSEVDVTLNAYKTIKASDITWKYSFDGGKSWRPLEGFELPYSASEYFIGAEFTGDDGETHIAIVSAVQGMILYAGDYYVSERDVYTADFYHIEELAFGTLTITPFELELYWDTMTLMYTGESQYITLKGSTVLEPDKGDIYLDLKYYPVDKSSGQAGEQVTPDAIINAGDYRVVVAGILSDNLELQGSYVLPKANSCDFTIAKADVMFAEVWYEEAHYGKNMSYQSNPQGLRRDKIFSSFGDNKEVGGAFYFVKYNVAEQDYKELETAEEIIDAYLKVAGRQQVLYRYIPDDIMNYNNLVGSISITVNTQVSKKELKVARVAGEADFYIVGSMVKTDRLEVFEKYASYYEEGGEGYGRLQPLDSARYRAYVNGMQITADSGYTITKNDGDEITIRVVSATNSNVEGSIKFRIYNEKPTSLEIPESSKTRLNRFRPEWYIGDVFDLPSQGDYAFELLLRFTSFDPVTVYFSDVTYTVEGVEYNKAENKFRSAGTATITFTYSGLSASMQLVINPKKDIEIITPSTKIEKVGTVEKAPELMTTGNVSLLNGLEGVTYTYQIVEVIGSARRSAKESDLKNKGTYEITYKFQITTTKYNKPDDFILTLEIKDIAYTAVWVEFTEAQLTSAYTGNAITAPKAKLSHIRDEIQLVDLENVGTVSLKSITLNGVAVDEIKGVGDYTVIWTATYDGMEVGPEFKYVYKVTRADNSVTFTVRDIVVGDTTTAVYSVTNLKFGTMDDVSITYSANGESGWTTTMPKEVGVWYIRLQVAGTNDYKEIDEIKKFNINLASLSSDNKNEEGDVWVDVDGGEKGLEPDTVLEVKKVEQDELDSMKIKKRSVDEGYDVSLKNAVGEDIELKSEITIKLLISEEFRGAKKLSVHLVTYAEDGKMQAVEITGVTRSEDGKYLIFSVSEVGRFVITEVVNTVPVGLLVAVIICAVIAAGLIVACVLVFLKKRDII